MELSSIQTVIEAIDMKQLAKRAQTQSLQQFYWLLRFLKGFSPAQAKILLENIPAPFLAKQMTNSNLSTVANIIGFMQELELSSIQTVVEAIDMEQLAKRAQTQGLQQFYWLLRTLMGLSPTQTKILLENIPAPLLAVQITNSDLRTDGHIIDFMRGLEVPSTLAVIEAIDMKQLAKRAQTQSLQQFYWLLRSLKGFSPVVADRLLKTITLRGLASLCCSQKARIHDITNLLNHMLRDDRRQFLQQLSPQDLANIFERSPLGHTGSFLQHNYWRTQLGYAVFREQVLASKLATSSLNEIGKFIHRIKQIPKEGTQLANEVLGLLITTDSSGQLSSTDTHQSKKLYDHFEKSDLHNIRSFIYGIAGLDAQYLEITRQSLEASNMVDKLAIADVGTIGFFLWNVCTIIDKELAQAYSKLVDAQDRSNMLSNASLGSLCHFLWNLTFISNLPRLQTLDNPIVAKRLQAAWEEHIGLGVELLGIMAITIPYIARDLQLPPIDVQKEHLRTWLIQLCEEQSPHPYILALTLHGLRTYDELEAQAIARVSLDLTKVAHLLEAALMEPIIAPLSMLLLQETREWLEKLSVHPN